MTVAMMNLGIKVFNLDIEFSVSLIVCELHTYNAPIYKIEDGKKRYKKCEAVSVNGLLANGYVGCTRVKHIWLIA